ncbi:hypothetical protein AQUCO_00500060v1 [Aquilegia coerulea]|uniref:Myb-like domain-containing protein n=1 Tax=Aquilegia coerulea TaxID=218851 RepID=A0A2G5EQ55_AQUCA|nr:hypothetical protein AQUCO_00500060v1 [Aquilegia coerulea]
MEILSHEYSIGTIKDSTKKTSIHVMKEFSEDEESLIARMYKLLGNRWVLIAGRLPGRTAEEIENYWTSRQTSLEDVREFSEDEAELIFRMFKLVGERWHLIAGRIPGRTAQQIEKYWTSRYSSSASSSSSSSSD